jgi:hypothetical protein
MNTRVLSMPHVIDYLNGLVDILYEKNYFSFEDTAVEYVVELFEDITANLPVKISRPAPKHFERFGKNMEYAAFKKNKHTTWYVFFDTYKDNEETVFLVRHIENNHTAAQYFDFN